MPQCAFKVWGEMVREKRWEKWCQEPFCYLEKRRDRGRRGNGSCFIMFYRLLNRAVPAIAVQLNAFRIDDSIVLYRFHVKGRALQRGRPNRARAAGDVM